MVVLLHTIFKGLALTVYLGSSLIMNSFIASFIFIMMLLSADFWVVKNVSGRLLAGLRWWSVVTETGELVWRSVGDQMYLASNISVYSPKIRILDTRGARLGTSRRVHFVLGGAHWESDRLDLAGLHINIQVRTF